MMKRNLSDKDNSSLKEFCDFVEATPISPSSEVEFRVLQRVNKDLQPHERLVLTKLLVIESSIGFLTLFICPQFDFVFGGHNAYLHALHETLDPFLFYMICGMIFIVLGAVLGGIALNHSEIQSIKKSKYIYYPIYAFCAYMVFVMFGADILLLSSLPWIFGVTIGNLFGFGLAVKVRHLLA